MRRPVGVFDSGIGGLSVLRALRAELPHQNLVSVADSGHAPYGERDPSHAIERTQAVARYLLTEHHIQTLVVACNTATAAAIHLLREQYPELPIVGVEPALKPAQQTSTTRRVGVLATRSTLRSAKFQTLHESLKGPVEFVLEPCDGLADAIERQDEPRIAELSRKYVSALGPLGRGAGDIDTVVLGCTHYPLVTATLQQLLGPEVSLVESGVPVARQVHRVIPRPADTGDGSVQWYTTGRPHGLESAVQRWLDLPAQAHPLTV